MAVRFRTNVSLLAVSAVLTLLGALFNVYGGARIIPGSPILETAAWPVIVIAYGIGGVALLLVKSIRAAKAVRRSLGVAALMPIVLGLAASAYYRSGLFMAFFIPAVAVAAFALWIDEPAWEEADHDLFPLFSGAVMVLTGLLFFLFPSGRGAPFPAVVAIIVVPAGLAGLVTHWRFPRSRADAIGYTLMAVAFAVMAASALAAARPIFAVMYAPLAILLMSRKLFRHFNLGAPEEKGVTEENRVVHQFEEIAKLTAWFVYAFTYVHVYYHPVGFRTMLFALFVAAFVIFTVEYDAISAKHSTFRKYMFQSHVNSVLLGVVSHFTGGLESPYLWFYVLILVSGSIETDPGHILLRLAVINGYFVFEAFYGYIVGRLTTTVIVDHLLLVYAVVLVVGIYSYRLSVKRKEVDQALHHKNQELKAALGAAERAKELATMRGREIEIAKNRNEAIMASLGDGVIALDPRGGIVLLNPAAESVVGKTLIETRGKRIPDLFAFRQEGAPGMRIGDYLDSALKGSAVALPENLYLEAADGRRAYLAGSLVPIFDEAKKVGGVVMTFREITYLREVDEMKNGFLSVAAHQLRTPLSTIRWFLELLNDPAEGTLKKNQKVFAESAYRSLRNMVELVNRLLAVTRLEGGRVPVRPVPVDLKEMTDAILNGLAASLKGRHLSVHLKADEITPNVLLDEQLAGEVFTNLIENAIRYTPDSGVILIAIFAEDQGLHWSIKDSGIGIPQEQQAKIFEKFYRADNAVAHTAEGTGLGLYLAKFIVGTWGGKIWFESEPGKGATFHVTVPFRGMTAKEGRVSLNA